MIFIQHIAPNPGYRYFRLTIDKIVSTLTSQLPIYSWDIYDGSAWTVTTMTSNSAPSPNVASMIDAGADAYKTHDGSSATFAQPAGTYASQVKSPSDWHKLDVGSGNTADVLDALKAGLQSPLSGMGTAFFALMAHRSGQLATIAHTWRHVVWADNLFSGASLRGASNWVWIELPRGFLLNRALFETGDVAELVEGLADQLPGPFEDRQRAQPEEVHLQ